MADDAEISLAQFVKTMWRLKWLHLLIIAASMCAGFAAMKLIPPSFKSTTLLLYEDYQQTQPTQLSVSLPAALGGGSSSQTTDILQLAERMQTRAFLKSLIQENDLLTQIFADKWDTASKRWLVEPDKEPTIDTAYGELRRDISINLDRSTLVIELAVSTGDPELSHRLSNLLVSKINEAYRADLMQRTNQRIEYIQRKVGVTQTKEMRELLFDLYRVELGKQMLASVTADFPLRVIDPPVTPQSPSFPTPVIIYPAAALLCITVILFITLAWPSARPSN